MPTQVYKADVLIIGGGLAGICAAAELLDHGQTVIIVDRDRESAFGGLAKRSFGGIFLVDSLEQRLGRIRDSPDLAFDDWVGAGELDEGDTLARSWVRAYVDNCGQVVDRWLRRRSVRFFPVVHWLERGFRERGNSVPRFHMVWGTGHRLVELITANLFAHASVDRLTTLFRHRVLGLQSTNGHVSGVYGRDEAKDQDFRVEAGAVIIASGGYCGSVEWLTRHWDPELGDTPGVILNGSHRYATGSMHRAAELVGAEVSNRNRAWFYAAGIPHPRPSHSNHGLSIVPPRSALWLDKFGRRIGPQPLVSGFDTRHLVSSVCRSPGGYSWQLMNWRIACKELAVSGAEYNDAIRKRNVLGFIGAVVRGNRELVTRLVAESESFVVGDTLDQLVERMNALTQTEDIQADVLKRTVRDYDDRVIAGKPYDDEQLRRIEMMRGYRGDRVRTCRSQRLLDERAMPLLAIREFILSRKSLGGIRTNLDCSVLLRGRSANAAGQEGTQTISGLYAVGEAAGFGGGGIHGKRSLEGTFLGTCIYTGRVAGMSIARG